MDPTGTVGRTKGDPALDELALAYKGGPAFSERLTQLSAARDAHEKAFAQLNLGKDVLAVRAATQAQLEQAKQKAEESEQVLVKAQIKAKAVMDEAEQDAKETRAKATAYLREQEAAATAKHVAADKYSDDIKSAADTLKAAAAQLREEAERHKADVQQQAVEGGKYAQAAVATQAEAEKVKATYQNKLAKLEALVRDLHGS